MKTRTQDVIPITKTDVKDLIKAFKEEIRNNRKEIRSNVKQENYDIALHLVSVNGCLEYVIGVLKSDLLRED